MKKLFLLAALFAAAAFSSCSKHDDVETPVPPDPVVVPEPQPLAIVFDEGYSLQFSVDETKTVHYTITGGSDKTAVKAEMQTPDDAYTVETTPTSATKGTIAITAKMPTDNCVVVTVSDGSQTITAEIAVSAKPISQKLAIAFAEGNSLEFGVNETKTIHYTITGGSDKTVVSAKMQKSDNAYTVDTTPTSATEGTIAITAQMPTDNCVIVTVSDGSQTVTAEIVVTLNAFDGKTAVAETPGTLSQLLADHDESAITELTIIGNLNDEDIATLKNLPNLAVLDMENADLESLPSFAFRDNTSLTSVKLPNTLKTIGKSAFNGCNSLTSVTIPDCVTEIGAFAFDRCSSLSAFYGKFASSDNRCLIINGELIAFAPAGLTSYTIPDGVTTIGSWTFNECSSLTSVTIPDCVTEIGAFAFDRCSGLSAFYGKFASSDNRCLIINGELIAFAPAGLTSYTIPDGVTSIGSCALIHCNNLKNVTIGNSVTTIWNDAFSYCSDLISVTISNSVTSIKNGAFGSCFRLSAFYGKFASSDNRCLIINDELIAFAPAGLTSYTISDGVTSIGNNAFEHCNNLTNVTIPDSVTSIGSFAFEYCSSLTSIYSKANVPPSVDTFAFYNVSTTLTLYVPTGCKAAYAAADGWKNFTQIIETQF